jgi:hypothetical protein
LGDRGAARRDNLLAGQGRVTSAISIGNSRIYFITLNNGTRFASINMQPGNRNYVVLNDRAFSLDSPSNLVSFLRNRNLLEGLRRSMVKVHLQENPHLVEELKQYNKNN